MTGRSAVLAVIPAFLLWLLVRDPRESGFFYNPLAEVGFFWVIVYGLVVATRPLRSPGVQAPTGGPARPPKGRTTRRAAPKRAAPKPMRRPTPKIASASQSGLPISLSALRWGCSEYGRLSSYDISLQTLNECVGSGLDPSRPDHRACLFTWLNAWGCRQFALTHHATTASDSLLRWADVWLSQLPAPDRLLTDLDAGEIRRCAAAYEALRHETASYKTRRDGSRITVTFGPTGAAKTLFAFRPFAVPPWDDPIRKALGFSGDLEAFRRYLKDVASQLRSLASEAGVPVSVLPSHVGRPSSSPPKLIDEYNWVTLTRNLLPPVGR